MTFDTYAQKHNIDLQKYLQKYSTLSLGKTGSDLITKGTREKTRQDLTDLLNELQYDLVKTTLPQRK